MLSFIEFCSFKRLSMCNMKEQHFISIQHLIYLNINYTIFYLSLITGNEIIKVKKVTYFLKLAFFYNDKLPSRMLCHE